MFKCDIGNMGLFFVKNVSVRRMHIEDTISSKVFNNIDNLSTAKHLHYILRVFMFFRFIGTFFVEPTSENSANVAEFCFCCFTAFSYFRQYSIVTNFEENRNIVRICDVSSRSILRPLHLILSMSTFRYCILRGA